MKVKFNLKSESVFTFLEERILGYNRNSESSRHGGSIDAYHLIRDEMFFKKDCGIEVGDVVKMELSDQSQMSRKELINHYTYTAEVYDDVAIKMVKSDIKVTIKE